MAATFLPASRSSLLTILVVCAYTVIMMIPLTLVAVVVVALETGALKAAFKQSFGSLVGLVAVAMIFVLVLSYSRTL